MSRKPGLQPQHEFSNNGHSNEYSAAGVVGGSSNSSSPTRTYSQFGEPITHFRSSLSDITATTASGKNNNDRERPLQQAAAAAAEPGNFRKGLGKDFRGKYHRTTIHIVIPFTLELQISLNLIEKTGKEQKYIIFLQFGRDQSKNDNEAGQMSNVSPGSNAAKGGEAQNTAAAPSQSSPSGQPLKNGVQRHQGGPREFEDMYYMYNSSKDRDVFCKKMCLFVAHKLTLKSKNSQLRNQSVREPMMSMVAEENAAGNNGNASNQSPDSKDQKPQPPGAKQLPKLSRAAQSILQMRTVGAVVKQVTGARRSQSEGFPIWDAPSASMHLRSTAAGYSTLQRNM